MLEDAACSRRFSSAFLDSQRGEQAAFHCPAAFSLRGDPASTCLLTPPCTTLLSLLYFSIWPPLHCWAFCAFHVSPGAGVPQQLQAIQVHPNTSNSDSSPETSHTSTNSTGRSTTCSVKCSGLIKSYIERSAMVKLQLKLSVLSRLLPSTGCLGYSHLALMRRFFSNIS